MSVDLRPYQNDAVTEVDAALADTGRALLVLPCGTGKTVVAGHLTTTGRTIVFVPTVALLTQTLDRINPHRHPALAVCAPTAVDDDDLPSPAPGIADRVTTDPAVVAQFITAHPDHVIVSTYASAPVIADALTRTNATIDLIICDEAHRTTGHRDKSWALPLDITALPAHRRLFMTATTRIVTPTVDPETGAVAHVWSMDSDRTYGPTVAPLSFRSAISSGYLSDYRIALIAVTSTEAADLFATLAAADFDLDLEAAATQLALLNHVRDHPDTTSILVFHNSISASKQWTHQMQAIADHLGTDADITHIDGTTAAADRAAALSTLSNPQRLTIVSNCRLLSEGVDVPALDAVLFAAPRSSSPEIVQIIGRAIRPHPRGPEHRATIILPVMIPPESDSTADELVASTGHYTAWEVLTTLAEEDSYTNRALHAWRLHSTTEPTEPFTHDLLEVDTTILTPDQARSFELHLQDRTTSHWPITAYLLRELGNPNPRPDFILRRPGRDPYPLGRRVAQARAAYRAGRMPTRIANEFTAIPGFTFLPSPTTDRRTRQQWIDLAVAHVAITGAPISRTERHITVHGTTVALGRWWWSNKDTLTQEEHARVTTALEAAP